MSKNKLPKLDIVTSLQLTPEILADIEQVIENCVERKLTEIVRKCLNEMDLEIIIEEKVRQVLAPEEAKSEIEFISIPREKAIVKIKSYVDNHPDCSTSDIIYDLGLDPDLVLSVLDELQKKGLIRGIKIE